jgi:hypothetical protein
MVTTWSLAIGECANHKQSLVLSSGGGGNRTLSVFPRIPVKGMQPDLLLPYPRILLLALRSGHYLVIDHFGSGERAGLTLTGGVRPVVEGERS